VSQAGAAPLRAGAGSPAAAPVSPFVLKAAAGLLLLVLWEIVVWGLAPGYVARPSGIARVFFSVITDAQFLAAARATLWAVVQGLFVSLIVGTLIGFMMGRAPVVEHGLRYYVNSLFATPMVAILPLVTLWFGYNADARFAVIVFAAFFSVVVNACDGARSAPLFVGGGKAMAPVVRSHEFDLPKKVRAAGLRHALSAKARDAKLIVLDSAAVGEVKTKVLAARLGKLGSGHMLIVDGAFDRKFALSARNLAKVSLLPAAGLNVYDVLRRDTLVMTKAAIQAIEERLGSERLSKGTLA